MIKVKPLLNIITAVSRPQNLPLLEKNINKHIRSFTVRWYCMYDDRFPINKSISAYMQKVVSPGKDCSGAPQKNAALDVIVQGLCYFLDDDNLIHEDLDLVLLKTTIYINNYFYIFSQKRPKRVLEADPTNIKFNSIDIGQLFFKRELIGNLRLRTNCYVSDWYWIESIWKQHGEKFYFDKRILTLYNALTNKCK
jgi:hypothetical protein